jgi:DNA-binding GntR family transcriptional regulator
LQHQLIYPILYKKSHVEVKHSKRLVLVEIPTQQVSKLLQSSLNEPIIKLENIFYDQHNDVIDFSIVWTATHYHIELDF